MRISVRVCVLAYRSVIHVSLVVLTNLTCLGLVIVYTVYFRLV